MPEDSPRLLPGTLYMLILRTLSQGPLHGYAITRRIKQCSADVLDVEEGSLYPALNRMLVKGWQPDACYWRAPPRESVFSQTGVL